MRARHWLTTHPVWLAMGLSFGTIIGTSLVRFSYALFVPAMRADLGWSYLVLGTMNTAHAAGYLIGALTGYLCRPLKKTGADGDFHQLDR